MNGLIIGIIIGVVFAGALAALYIAMRGQGESSPLSSTALPGKDGHWRWKVDGPEMEWSDQFFEILGLTPGSVTPSTEVFNERIDPEDQERYREILNEAVQKGLPFQIELRCIRPSGEAVWVEVSGVPDTGSGDAPTLLTGTLSDVTTLKNLTTEVEDLRAKLGSVEQPPGEPEPPPEPSESTEAAPAPPVTANSSTILDIERDLNDFLTGILGWSQLTERQESATEDLRRCIDGIRANSKKALERIKLLHTELHEPSSTPYQPRKESEHTASIPATAAPGGGTIGSARVLFVDDQPLVVDLFVALAKALGFGVRGYTDPEAALTALQDAPDDFDILVCDLTMPAMPGSELIEQARIIKPAIFVIASSGVQDPEEIPGAHTILRKPYSIDSLKETIEAALQPA